MKITHTMGHLSAAVQVLEQAAYAARAEMDPLETDHVDEINSIVGRVQNIIATIEAGKVAREEVGREREAARREAMGADMVGADAALEEDERDLQRAEQSFYDREEGPREGEIAASDLGQGRGGMRNRRAIDGGAI